MPAFNDLLQHQVFVVNSVLILSDHWKVLVAADQSKIVDILINLKDHLHQHLKQSLAVLLLFRGKRFVKIHHVGHQIMRNRLIFLRCSLIGEISIEEVMHFLLEEIGEFEKADLLGNRVAIVEVAEQVDDADEVGRFDNVMRRQ